MRIYKHLILVLVIVFTAASQQQPNLHPDYVDGMKELRKGNYDAAIDHFTTAIEDDKYDAELYFSRGMAYLYQNNYSMAFNDLSEAVKYDPKHADAYNARGLAASYLEEIEIARADFNKAIELDKNFAQAYINRASLNIALENYEKALEDLKKASELQPDNPELYFQQARINHILGNYEKAIDFFTKTLNAGLENADIYYNRANSYYKAGKFQKAVEDYTKTLELEPEDNEALNNRAMAYDQLGKTNKAQSDRKKLNERVKMFYKPIEDVEFGKFSTPGEKVTLSLPKEWKTYVTADDSLFTEVIISKDEIDPKTNALRTGVTIGIVKDLKKQHDVTSDSEALQFWEASQSENSRDYYIYQIKSKTQKLFHGYPAAIHQTRLQFKPDFLEFRLYEYAIAIRNDLVYLYFQSPKEDFHYYKKIFEKAMDTVEVNVDEDG